MTREVIVTGGCGFIGSHLVENLLLHDYKVHVLDNLSKGSLDNLKDVAQNKNLKIWTVNILEQDLPPISNVDYFFHLAGIGDIVPSINYPVKYFETNVLGTIKMLEFARKIETSKFIYAASSSCYGLAKTPTSESSEINPQHPYALSKYLGEMAVLNWTKIYGFQSASVRIFNAYGPRAKTKGAYGAMFGVFLRQKIANSPLTVVGDGSQARDFVYVTEVAKGFRLVAENEKAIGPINLGKGKSDKVLKIAKLISKNLEYLPDRPGEPHETLADIKKLIEVTGWKPQIQIEEGVDLMMKAIQEWNDAPLWDKYKIKIATEDWFKYLSKTKLEND